MSAFDKLLNRTPAKAPAKKSGSAFDKLLVPKTQQQTALDQHAQDVAKANGQWKDIQSKLDQPPKTSITDKLKGFARMDLPSMVKNTYQNTSKGTPLQTLASVGSGLLDIGPRIANSIGVKNIVKSLPVVGSIAKAVDVARPNTIPNPKLPLPGKTAKDYSNNNSDLSKAVSEATTQVGGYELGGGLTKLLGLSRIPSAVLGNVLGGQAVTEANTPKDRAKQAGFDAAFGLATEGAGAGLSKLRPREPIPIESALKASEIPQEAPIAAKPIETPSTIKTGSNAPKIETVTKPSKVGKSIEAKTIEDGIVKSFSDTAHYDPKTVADQSQRVSKLITEDLPRTKRIVNGEALPKDMSASMFIKGVEDHARATGDIELLRDLSKSKLASDTSIHGQELRFLRERSPDSPVKAIQDLEKVREDALARKGVDVKKNKNRFVATESRNLRSEIKKSTPKPKDWSAFVDSIKC